MKSPPNPSGKRTPSTEPASGRVRERLWRIIYHSDTPAGRAYDVALLWLIGISVVVVALDSVDSLRASYGLAFNVAEWVFTIIFTIEYVFRLCVVKRPMRYATSFLGVIDLLAFAPSYLQLFVTGAEYLMILRVLRLLRMFRVLKMAHHVGEAGVLMNALLASRAKISVFFVCILSLVCVEGTMMYLVENTNNPGFSSIPQSVYWAIVTITTVGYGDLTPVTVLGKMMASVIMLTGFAILAVPTGIVSAELGREISRHRRPDRRCDECGWEDHDAGASYCNQCGRKLNALARDS